MYTANDFKRKKLDIKDIEKLIPRKYFDTHIHAPFLKSKTRNKAEDRPKKMLSEYFFNSGLNLKNLKNLYPFNKELHGIAIPIPYGPFSAKDINENILKNEANVKNVQVVLRGDFLDRELIILEKQIRSSKKVIGLKLYQYYEIKNTSEFLKNVMSEKLLMLANKYGLILFMHTNSLDVFAVKFLGKVLKKYKKIKVVLTHGGINLTGYYSYGFDTKEDLKKSLITKENIDKNKKHIRTEEEKYKLIAKTPRLYVNTAFIVSELNLYPIFKILATKNRIIYGSDLPFAYANRIREEREKYDISAPNIKKIYEGKTLVKLNKYHENLLFFLERIYNVVHFTFPKKEKQIFAEIMYDNIVRLTSRLK